MANPKIFFIFLLWFCIKNATLYFHNRYGNADANNLRFLFIIIIIFFYCIQLRLCFGMKIYLKITSTLYKVNTYGMLSGLGTDIKSLKKCIICKIFGFSQFFFFFFLNIFYIRNWTHYALRCNVRMTLLLCTLLFFSSVLIIPLRNIYK